MEGRESDAIKNLLERWMSIRDSIEKYEQNPVTSRAPHNHDFVNDEEMKPRELLEKEMQEIERQLKGYDIDPRAGKAA